MFKGEYVKEWANDLARKRPDASFTAGQCARETGVSVNTAKKYLKKLVKESDWLYEFAVQMNNGIVATCYAFSQDRCGHGETITRSWIASGDIINTQYICADCGKVVRWTEQQNYYSGWVGSSDTITERGV